jgi:hypothetical protein
MMGSMILVVGKSSKLYNSARGKIGHVKVDEVSSVDALGLREFTKYSRIIVFSLYSGKELSTLVERVGASPEICVIGSISALSKIANRFSYSRLKKNQLNEVVKLRNSGYRISYIVFGDFNDKAFAGKYATSSMNSLVNLFILTKPLLDVIICDFKIKGVSSKSSRILSVFEILFAPIASFFIKIFSSFSYGYSNASLYVMPEEASQI